MLLGLLPALLVLIALLAALGGLVVGLDDLVAWSTPFAEEWADLPRRAVRGVLAAAVVVGALVVSTLVFTGLTLAVGDPFYERIWRSTEELLGDPPAGPGVPWWRSVRDGLVLAAGGVMTGGALLLVGLLPVVGAAVASLLGLAVSGRLLAGELLSRPLEARGLDRHARRALLRGRREVWGFGLAVQACFLVPGGAAVVMPGAVAGATVLARELLGSPGRRAGRSRRDAPQVGRPDST